MKHQVLFSLKNNDKVFMNVVCCSRDQRFKGSALSLLLIRWMDDLRFLVLFNSISVISGQWYVHYERLCAMEPRLHLKRIHLERESNSGPPDQQASAELTKLPGSFGD